MIAFGGNVIYNLISIGGLSYHLIIYHKLKLVPLYDRWPIFWSYACLCIHRPVQWVSTDPNIPISQCFRFWIGILWGNIMSLPNYNATVYSALHFSQHIHKCTIATVTKNEPFTIKSQASIKGKLTKMSKRKITTIYYVQTNANYFLLHDYIRLFVLVRLLR